MKITTKKTAAALIASLMTFGLVACGANDTNGTHGNDTTTPETTQNVTESVGEESSQATESSQANKGKYVVPAESDFYVEDVDGGVEIKKYHGDETIIEIPAQIGGKNVVSLGCSSFEKTGVVDVKLPDTVITVDERAFAFCESLVELTLGANVEVLGSGAVSGCCVLTKINLNDKLREIGIETFSATESLKEIALPSSLETIGDAAFYYGGIERITIPGSVEMVSTGTFASCSNLTEVVIEDGVKVIGVKAFEDCAALTTVEFPASLEELERKIFDGSENVTIYGSAGSAAESYAAENGLKFVSK